MNNLIIGWILFLLAELILAFSVKPLLFYIISILFFTGLTLINLW